MDLTTRPLTAPDRCTVYRPAPTPRTWLGVWAHPDDEAYLSAGAMDRIVRDGGRVTVVALSDGEAGFPSDDPRPPDVRRQQRRAELRTAMAEIGVRDVRFLGLADGAVSDACFDDRIDIVVDALAEIIDEIRPDVVATFGPDGVTGHPDHVACWQLVTRAWSEVCQGDLWYAAKSESWLDTWRDLHDRFGMWMTEEPTGVADCDIEAVLRLDGADLDRKRRVLAGHHSQTAAVAAAIGEQSYRRWIAEETFRRPLAVELERAGVAGLPIGIGAS